VNAAIPRRLDAIINKAMEKDRSHRYQSAAEIRADLVSVQQQMQSTGAHTRKWLAAGALLASLALATVIFWRAQGHAPLSPNETIVIASITKRVIRRSTTLCTSLWVSPWSRRLTSLRSPLLKPLQHLMHFIFPGIR
jgi:serine/threonine protein kinase